MECDEELYDLPPYDVKLADIHQDRHCPLYVTSHIRKNSLGIDFTLPSCCKKTHVAFTLMAQEPVVVLTCRYSCFKQTVIPTPVKLKSTMTTYIYALDLGNTYRICLETEREPKNLDDFWKRIKDFWKILNPKNRPT